MPDDPELGIGGVPPGSTGSIRLPGEPVGGSPGRIIAQPSIDGRPPAPVGVPRVNPGTFFGAIFAVGALTLGTSHLRPHLKATHGKHGLTHRSFLGQIFRLPLRWVRRAENAILAVVSRTISSLSHLLGLFLRGLATLADQTYVQFEGMAIDTATALERMRRHVIPTQIRRQVRPVEKHARTALRVGHAASHSAHTFDRQSRHRDARLNTRLYEGAIVPTRRLRNVVFTHVMPEIQTLTRTTTTIETRTVPRIERQTRIATRTAGRAENKADHALELIAGGSIIAQALRIFTRRAPWTQCRSVDRVGRRICSTDPDLLDSLLTDLLLISGTVSLVEFTRAMQGVMPLATDAMRGFVRELPGGWPQVP